jgi:hypothetical protein
MTAFSPGPVSTLFSGFCKYARTLTCVVLCWLLLCAGGNGETPPKFSWQDTHAKVLPTGGLEWRPWPFVFEKGDSARYIDFEAGDDAKDGKTPQTAWKHHPWDANAAGEAKASKGVQTFVFKGGVVYRGALKASESGAPGKPLRLTSDPAWGKGEALLYGSTQIKGGWKKATAAEAPEMPKPDSVWFLDVGKDYDPDPERARFSALWQIDGANVDRLHIAREPNYDLSDPNNPVKNWPIWSGYNPKTSTLTSPALKNLSDKNLLAGGAIWTETDFLMGAATVHSLAQSVYDPEAGSISGKDFSTHWFSKIPRAKVHFMIENVAKFLDAPGEYFFAATGPKAGRLYLWPARGIDPNRATYEVAQIRMPIVITDQHDIVISGLEFRYNDPDDGGPKDNYVGNGSPAPCIRLLGNCANITVKNCKFYHVAGAVASSLRADGDGGPSNNKAMDNIIVSDNDIQHSERGGTILIMGDSQKAPGAAYGRLGRVEVMRNRVVDTGFRCGYSPWSSIPAISVDYPETCEVAGNIVDTSFGNGIITYGGKGSGSTNTVPLTRMLVHHNQIDNTMLGCNDYGGLEHFQGGPVYLYNNITRNCVGNRTLGGELGYSLYLDGGFKCYCFNNIIAGLVKDKEPDYYNNCGYFMVFGFMDQLFNNTIYHVNNSLDGSSGNRSNILGNLMLDSKTSFIGQNRAGDVSMAAGGDTGAMGRMGIPTMAYGSNVFFGNPKDFGRVAGTGTEGGKAPVVPGKTLEELRDKLQAEKCRVASLGWQVPKPPLVDPAKKDYRLTSDSGAKERGVKYFVPWGLARNVGEWNFFKSATTPEVVLGEGFYMTDEYLNREMYYFIPRNDLTVSQCTAEDYVAGQLEDWIDGALVFDGKSRVATLTHAEMTKSMEYPGGKNVGKLNYDGSKRETLDMGTNNFLIEVVFKTIPGHTNGVLVSKLGPAAGYELAIGADGGPRLTLLAGGAKATAASTVKVNDGKWHHLLAEVDRAAGKSALYVDGKAAGEAKLDALAKTASLANTADFVVGQGFAGAVDFLRVCRSTLAESKTGIDELYAWEFAGPFLRDFTGKAPAAGKRDAGAIGR